MENIDVSEDFAELSLHLKGHDNESKVRLAEALFELCQLPAILKAIQDDYRQQERRDGEP